MPMKKESLDTLFNEFQKYNHIDPALNDRYGVKRGLRNADGTGVLAGLTQICNVHGYILNEGEKCPVEGELTYRGVNVRDMVESCVAENRFGYEEVSYLLLFGHLPNQKQLDFYRQVLSQVRALPQSFVQDMILKAPSRDIMNKLGRSILALYSYDDFSQDEGLEAELKKAIYIIARMPPSWSTAIWPRSELMIISLLIFTPSAPAKRSPRASSQPSGLPASTPKRKPTCSISV